ncbi:M20 family metallo-hydrolase [Pseudomonas typographi]|uniref:M20 family metallo-hydrolase n=1 Tax=Pseudomonas typographi TaxID=2715964 RepID=UPI0019315A54|nr:M20 family metallo-hydrolase [Pseudomonas typographi]
MPEDLSPVQATWRSPEAPAIQMQRLWDRHMALATFGALDQGGVNRPAFSPIDAQARLRVIDWGARIGLLASLDSIGNLFLRRPGTRPELAPVFTGSHLDTQPTGGKFDGAYGVLAGLEMLETFHDAGCETLRDIVLVIWANEEGSRFAPTTMGSSVFAASLSLAQALQAQDEHGERLSEVLPTFLDAHGPLPVALDLIPFAYVEAHIEQGPVLEAEQRALGIVTGIQGLRWFEIEVCGQEAHAGTTPKAARADALHTAVNLAHALFEYFDGIGDEVRFTIGRWRTEPGSPNTVPGRVKFTIDLRHQKAESLAAFSQAIEDRCQAYRGVCEVSIAQLSESPPIEFSESVQHLLDQSAQVWGVPRMVLISGATHDAKWLNAMTPSGMLFVPCEHGISHNQRENTKREDLAAGAQVLAESILRLARQAN